MGDADIQLPQYLPMDRFTATISCHTFSVWAVLLQHFLLLSAQFGVPLGTRTILHIPAFTTKSHSKLALSSAGFPYLVAILEKVVFASELLFQVLNEGLFCSSNFMVGCLLHRVDASLFVIHWL